MMAQKENKEEMKQQKMIVIHKCQSHLAPVYLFFSKVLKSSSPESSFPSVLLQKNTSIIHPRFLVKIKKIYICGNF